MPFPSRAFLHLNGSRLSSNEVRSQQDVILALPRGAYTSLRVDHLKVALDWNLHLARLENSVKLIAEQHPDVFPAVHRNGLQTNNLRQRIAQSFKQAIIETEALSKGEDISHQLVVILITDARDRKTNYTDIYTYIRHSPNLSQQSPPIHVWIKGKGRSIPGAKYSRWILDRKSLEEEKPQECEEVILINDEGGLLEGLTSNVYIARKKGKSMQIQTAGLGDGVLSGTYRRVLINVAKELQIDVDESCPLVAQSTSWSEAFISNSVVGIRPISKMIVDKNDVKDVVFDNAPGKVATTLMERIEIMRERTPISAL